MVYRVTISIHGDDYIYTCSNIHQAHSCCEIELNRLIAKYSPKYTIDILKRLTYSDIFDMVYMNDETLFFVWETFTRDHDWPESFGHIENLSH
jgi:hypothetical protein